MLDHPLLADALIRYGGDLLAVLEHADGIGNLQNVVEEMRDEDHAGPTLAESAHEGEEALDLGRRECRGRFVENDDTRTRIEHTPDFHHLLPSERERFQRPPYIHLYAQALQVRASLAHHRAPVHRTQPCERLLAQKDIFSNGELLDHAEFLVDHPDAGCDRIAGGMEVSLLPIQAHRALILRMYAGDDLHQCALARSDGGTP